MKTLEGWNKLGFLVKKGSKSTKKSDSGKALFSRDQVEKLTPKRHGWNDSNREYSNEDYEFDRDFRDVEFYDRDWG